VTAFAVGRGVALRNVWNGRIVSARPVTVVLDDPGLHMLYVQIGAVWMAPAHPDGTPLRLPIGEWTLRQRRWDATHILSFAWPGDPHAVLLFWDEAWLPIHWYVNLQSPLRRTEVGFDYTDLILDATAPPDRSGWAWKDEEEFAEAIDRGAIALEDGPRLRAEGQRTVRRVLDREPPFDRDWWDWRPDPSWPRSVLPEGWDRA
jgi:hypothetical protein